MRLVLAVGVVLSWAARADAVTAHADALAVTAHADALAEMAGPVGLAAPGTGHRALETRPVPRVPKSLIITHQSSLANDVNVVRVMTYNIRYNNPGDGVNAWPNRRDRLAALVRFQAPDIVGFQEALRGQVDDLAEQLPGYEWVGVGRDDGADGGEFSPVFYRADRVELLDHGTFWLSDSPDEVGSVGWDAALPRVATWVRVSVEEQEYLVVNTHFDHVGEQARHNSAELIVTRAAAISEGVPLIVLGDFNAAPDSVPYATLGEALFDAREVARDVYGPEETFFGFSVADTVGRRIDHVFVDARLAVSQVAVLTEHVRGRYLSDHLPVVVDIKPRRSW